MSDQAADGAGAKAIVHGPSNYNANIVMDMNIFDKGENETTNLAIKFEEDTNGFGSRPELPLGRGCAIPAFGSRGSRIALGT